MFHKCSTHLSGGCGARVGEEAVIAVDAEGAETSWVGRGVSDCVQHLELETCHDTGRGICKNWDLHVPDVVDVQGLLQANHKPRSVQLHCQDCVAVAVLTDLSPCNLMHQSSRWIQLTRKPFLKWQTLSRRGEESETRARREEEKSLSTIVTSLQQWY